MKQFGLLWQCLAYFSLSLTKRSVGGADVVIAVNLNSDLLVKNKNSHSEEKKKPSEIYKLVQKAKKFIPAKYKKEDSKK